MENTPLHDLLLADARRYSPSEYTRSLLAAYRDVLLLWRAKFMSYEQIAATLTRHGLKVSPAAVGVFCRRTFAKAEIERERRAFYGGQHPRAIPTLSGLTIPNGGTKSHPATLVGKRGPKIARDDY